MYLVEQYIIHRSDPRYAVLDAASFASKNLYNAALYEMRQAFIHHGKRLYYTAMDKRMQPHETYRALPAKVAQQVLRQLEQCWTGYFEACQAYREDPSKFTGRPKLPKYKDKVNGRNLLVYTEQAISKRALKEGLLHLSLLPVSFKTTRTQIQQVRIIPRNGFYMVEVVYNQEPLQAKVNPAYYAGIDIGLNSLVALASNKPGFVPLLVNGRPVKSVNQYYNKRRAELQQQLGRPGTTKHMQRLTNTRTRRIALYLHTASRRIIDRLVQEGIGTLVIGKNDGWKQEANLGARINQHFVQIPHARFIEMLMYKAELVGITVLLTEESYTSKASFLDRDPLPKKNLNKKAKELFSGKRVKRGLYRASENRFIHADVNAAYNIIRKVAPHAFVAKGVEDGGVVTPCVVHPVRIVVPLRSQRSKRSQDR
ncbi:MAG: IS200/IS605 family element transposase accessory protein TnpB [Ktedonobacteraceae bacterium]|nr:IS200/IS605 family element transposase accessory protein TnpB [Ktedonobacteraceae bacterium]